jgi:hypothetical protein
MKENNASNNKTTRYIMGVEQQKLFGVAMIFNCYQNLKLKFTMGK